MHLCVYVFEAPIRSMKTVNQSSLNTRHASLTTLWLKAPLRPVTPRHTPTVSRYRLILYFYLSMDFFSPFLFSSFFFPWTILKCFVFLKYSTGAEWCVDTWMDGWVGGWVEKGGSFFTWPCVSGASLSPPLSVSLPQTGCVYDWAGSSCLSWAFWHSSLSCPPLRLRLSPAFWGFPSLLTLTLLLKLHLLSIYRHCVVSTPYHISCNLCFFGSFFCKAQKTCSEIFWVA